MTMPNGAGGVNLPDTNYDIGTFLLGGAPTGNGISGLETRTQDGVTGILANATNTFSAIGEAASIFQNTMLAGFVSMGQLINNLTRAVVLGDSSYGLFQALAEWASKLVSMDGLIAAIVQALLKGAIGPFADLLNILSGGTTGSFDDILDGVIAKLASFTPLTIFQDLIDGVLGGTGNPLSGLISFITGADGKAGNALTRIQSLIDGILGGTGNPLSALISFITGLLPKGLFNDFVGGLTSSAGTGAGGGLGIPLLDGALDKIGELFGKADTAQTTAVTTSETVQAQVVTTMQIDGVTYTKTAWSSSGTWTVPTASPGMKIIGFDLIAIGGGDAGGKPGKATEGAKGGLGGGYRRISLLPSQVTNSSYPVTIGPGGVGATSQGPGTTGGVTSIGSLVSSPKSGTSELATAFGPFTTDARPGKGGDGGGLGVGGTTTVSVRNSADTGSETVVKSFEYVGQDGQNGESSLDATGGTGGRSSSGWFGSSSSPTAGGSVTQPADGATGGAGGGGGASGAGAGLTSTSGQAGAAGSAPGGGGGGGGSCGTSVTVSPGNGGNGAAGYAAVIVKEVPL